MTLENYSSSREIIYNKDRVRYFLVISKLFRVLKKFNLIYSITFTNDSFGIILGFH